MHSLKRLLLCVLLLSLPATAGCTATPVSQIEGPIVLFRTDGREIRLEDEIRKQVPEQLVHTAMVAVPIIIAGIAVGMPPFGLIVLPIIMAKEAAEWPSDREWDPAVDGFFYGLGLLALLL